MTRFTFAPRTEFVPHPAGKALLKAVEIKDEGLQTQEYPGQEAKQVPKISILFESLTHLMEDGKPFTIRQWFTLSNHENATLTAFRQDALDRPLNEAEIAEFVPGELIDKSLECRIEHYEGQTGSTRARIKKGSVAPFTGDLPEPKREADGEIPF